MILCSPEKESLQAANACTIILYTCSDSERGTKQPQNKEQEHEWSYESFQQRKKNKWGPPHVDQENHPISIMVSLCIQVQRTFINTQQYYFSTYIIGAARASESAGPSTSGKLIVQQMAKIWALSLRLESVDILYIFTVFDYFCLYDQESTK